MAGIPDLEATIAKLEAAIDTAREVTRELHSSTKAARRVERDIHDAVEWHKARIAKLVEDAIARHIEVGLEQWHGGINEKIDESTQDIAAKFQRMANVCIFGNEKGEGVSLFDQIAEQLHNGYQCLEDLQQDLVGARARALPDLRKKLGGAAR